MTGVLIRRNQDTDEHRGRTTVGTQGEDICKLRREAWEETSVADTLISDFWSPEL